MILGKLIISMSTIFFNNKTVCNSNISKRIIGLDILRVLLALLIFLFHSRTHVLKCSYGIFNDFIEMGAIAMTGFFILSGYGLNLSSGKKKLENIIEIKTFYFKRLITIVPLYFAYAIINVTCNIIYSGRAAALNELLLSPIEILGLQSVFSSLFTYSHNGGSWFISCILICYLLYPLFHILFKHLTNKNRLFLVLLFVFILLWSPIIQQIFNLQTIYSNPFFRTLEFLLGVLVSQLNLFVDENNRMMRFIRSPFTCALSVFMLIVGVSMLKKYGLPNDYMLYSLVALPCFLCIIISLGYHRFNIAHGSKIILYLSKISFSFFLSQIIYMWYVVRDVLVYTGLYTNLIKIFVSLLVCVITANILHYLIEVPSSRFLKKKFLS